MSDDLGIDKEVEADLLNEVQVVINCAGVIDFNTRLDQALKINVRGALKLFQLAH